MQTKRAVMGAACALLLVTGAMAGAQDKTYTLERKLKKGDVVRHKVTINASLMGMDVVVVQNSKSTVKEINAKGQIVFQQDSEGGTVNVGGAEQTQEAMAAGVETRDKNNKLVDYKAPDGAAELMSPEVQKLMAHSSEVIFPEKAVKTGDSWSTEIDNPVLKDKKATIKTTFVGVEKVDGKELWKLKQAISADTDASGAKTTSEFTAWMDPADGNMVKMEGMVKDLPTQFGPLSWTMKLEKKKADKADALLAIAA